MGDKWTRDQKISALSAATGVVGLAANSIKPLTDLLGPIYPFIQPVAFIAIGTFMGYAFTRSFYAKQLSSKDEEISGLKNLRHERSDLFAEFRELTHDEQRQIVSVMLSEPAGIAPSDEQRKHMGSWVKMKDFVRHDAKTDRLHLLDGVKDMLLENPVHIYDLMAARVSDLERIVFDAGISHKRVAAQNGTGELDRLRIQNAALKSNALEKDGKIASLEKLVYGMEAERGTSGGHGSRSNEEKYAIIGTAGLSDLLWAYDYINENGPIPARLFGGKMESRRIQRLVSKGVLVSLGGMLSDGFSYDMAEEWSLFVHRERAEIERRMNGL